MAAITPDTEKKVEKEKIIPKDGQVMISILKDMGITEYEPRVINQMLEFSYKYVTTILEDARLYSQHAKKKTVDLEDVKLSVSMQAEQIFTSPPPRQSLLQLAHTKNSSQLPIPHNKLGLRLPPDRHCLTNCNYRLNGRNKMADLNLGLQPAFRGKGGGQIKVVAGKLSSQQAMMTAENSQNGTTTPMFQIQVQPNMGPAGLMKRKRDEEDYDGN